MDYLLLSLTNYKHHLKIIQKEAEESKDEKVVKETIGKIRKVEEKIKNLTK
jgi:hypothetical protein